MPQIENGAAVSEFSHLEKCLAFVAHRADASQDRNFTLAEGACQFRALCGGAGRASALRDVGALSDLDDVTVRIADVAANLAVLFLRLRDELSSSTFP